MRDWAGKEKGEQGLGRGLQMSPSWCSCDQRSVKGSGTAELQRGFWPCGSGETGLGLNAKSLRAPCAPPRRACRWVFSTHQAAAGCSGVAAMGWAMSGTGLGEGLCPQPGPTPAKGLLSLPAAPGIPGELPCLLLSVDGFALLLCEWEFAAWW